MLQLKLWITKLLLLHCMANPSFKTKKIKTGITCNEIHISDFNTISTHHSQSFGMIKNYTFSSISATYA